MMGGGVGGDTLCSIDLQQWNPSYLRIIITVRKPAPKCIEQFVYKTTPSMKATPIYITANIYFDLEPCMCL